MVFGTNLLERTGEQGLRGRIIEKGGEKRFDRNIGSNLQ
jgi:hypothetical protein